MGITDQFVQEAGNENHADLARSFSAQNEAQGLINRPDNYSQGLSFGDQALSQAIRGKYIGQNAPQQERLKFESSKMARESHLNKLAMANQLAADEAQMNLQKEILRQKKKQAAKAARGQILGTVLGIGAGVGGAVLGGAASGGLGAAAGGMAGYQLGAGVGQAVGGM